MLLGTLGSDETPFAQGSLFNFAKGSSPTISTRLSSIERWCSRGDARLQLQGAARRLRRVTALRRRSGRGYVQPNWQAGIPLVTSSSLKASLDIDWDDARQKKAALEL